MMKRSSSRNSRSRGFKGKHVLQICLLLGVCFWLIYQVKHSHAKKEEFDKNEAKLSVRTETGYGEVYLGRKSLHPRVKDEKHEEDDDKVPVVEEDESRHNEKQVQDDKEEDMTKSEEDDGEEESKNDEDENNEENDIEEEDREDGNNREGGEKERENNREEEEQEEGNKRDDEELEEETKNDDMEEDGRGGGDDEIDERDQHKIGDIDHENDLLDEEKEREEIAEKAEGETHKEGQVDHGASIEDHEAREKHYKADDASSAVTHDTQIVSNEQENISSNTNSLNENRIADNLESDKNSTERGEQINSTSELRGVNTGEDDGDKTAKSEGQLPENATNEQQALGDEQKEISVTSDVNKPQNETVGSADVVEASNLKTAESDLNSTLTENTKTAVKDFNSATNSELDGSNNTTKPEVVTEEVEQNSRSSTDAARDENSDKNESGETDKTTGLSTTDRTGDTDVRDADPINTSDKSVGQDQKDARIDLNTLPGNIAEGVNSGDTAAE